VINAKLKTDKMIRVGLVVAVILLLATVFMTVQASKSLIEVSENVQKSHIGLLKLEELFSNLTHAESGVRGYVITGTEAYLEPYYNTIKTINEEISGVRKLIPDDPIQEARIDEVESLASERLALLKESIDIRTRHRFEEAQKLILTGKRRTAIMGYLRDAINEIKADEYVLVHSRLEHQRKIFRKSIFLNASVIFLAFIFAGLNYLTINLDLTKRRQAEENLKESHIQLSKKSKYERIVSTIIQSIHKSGNLRDVLESAVESMSKNVDRANFCSFYIIEGEEAVLKAHRGHTSQYIQQASRIPYPKGITWKTIIEGQTIYVPDVDKDQVIGPAGRDMGIKSHVSVPIRYEGFNVGCGSIGAFEKHQFGEDEFKLLEVVADQIEIAINNVKQQELLRESEERYRTLFDQSPVGVYIFNKNFNITHCNERFAHILQTSRDKIIGINIQELKNPCVLPLMEKVFQGHTESYEGFYEATSSSEKLWVSIRLSPLRDDVGNVISGMAVVEDITERKQAEAEHQTREKHQRALVELGELALRGGDLTTLMSEAVSLLAKTLGVEYAKILELQPDGNSLLLQAGVGWKEGYVGHYIVDAGAESQAGYTLQCNETVIVEDIGKETRFTIPPLLLDHSVASGISTTIYGKARPYGVLGAHSPSIRTYTKDDVHFLQGIGNLISEAVERSSIEDELMIINTIMESVNKSSKLDDVFNTAIDKVLELTDINIVGIYLIDEVTNEAVLEAHRGYPDKYLEKAGRIPYPRGVTWRVIETDEVYVVQDVSTDPNVGPVGKESGFRSFMSVPIKGGERTIGAIHFHSNKKNKFGRREIEIFTSIGTQIAIAVAKAKKTEDLKLINEDLSTLNVITTSVHKSLNLEEVLNIALDKVVDITEFDIIMVYLVDEDTNEAVLQAHRGLTEDYIERAGRIPYPKGVTWRVIKSSDLSYIDDVQKDPDLGPAGKALGHHTHVSVPIVQENKTIGVVNFASRRVLGLTSRNLNLLNAVGNQIGIAIAQASLYEKSQDQSRELRELYEDLDERSKDLEILNAITQAVHKSLDLEEIYEIALDSVVSLEDVDMAMIYLVDEDRKEAILQAQRNLPQDYINRAGRIPYPKGTTWRVINKGEVLKIQDVKKEPTVGPAGRDLGHHSALGTPLTIEEKVIGVIWFLSYKERKFNEREVNLLSTIGNQIATAITKARLYQDLKDANEKLMELDQMKDEFISMASHEVRTPLTAINGFVSMLLEGDYGSLPTEAVEALADINTATNRLIGLTNYMLDVSRIEQGRLEFKISDFDIEEVCDKILTDLKPIAEEKGLKLEYQKPTVAGALLVSGDKFRVEQVIVNLIGNALKFTEGGGVIITHHANDSHIITDVIDTGIGIPEKDQGLLFQKFRSVKHSLSGDYKGGIGMGLYISKQFLNEMKGDVWLEKSELGKGSTFSFCLPKARDQLAPDREHI